jgi:glycosyl transferase family 25
MTTVIPIVVISLLRSSARRMAMIANFKDLGVSFSFFDAVDGQTMTADEIAAISPRPYPGHKDRLLTRGEIACAESFRRALQQFLASDGDYVCLAEDDCEFTADSVSYLVPAALRRLEPFDVMRLVTDPERERGLTRIILQDGRHAVHAPLRPGFFTLSQVFSRAGARKVLDGLVPLWAPIDMILYRDNGIVGLRVLELRPAVVLHREVETTIPQRFSARPRGHASFRVELRRRLWLIKRRLRAVRSYQKAWGWAGLLKLRGKSQLPLLP